MAYQVFWIVKNRVLYINESGELTLDDIRGSTVMVAEHMDSAYRESQDVIIGVVDMHNARLGVLLRSVISTAVQEIASVVDPRLWKSKPGFVVLITTSESAKMLISLLIRISSQPMTTVATLDEALSVIETMYPELSESLSGFKNSEQYAEAAG